MYFDYLDGAIEFLEDPTVVVEVCRLVGEVACQRAYTCNVVDDIVRSQRHGPSESLCSQASKWRLMTSELP